MKIQTEGAALELRDVLTHHPEVTHYWCGEQFFSVTQLLDGRCPEIDLCVPVETQVDGTGRMHINELGKRNPRRVFGLLSQALLSDFEVDPDEIPPTDCLASIAMAAKILMVDEDSVMSLIETGQLTSRIDEEGAMAVPVVELDRIVPEWWNQTGPNRE